MVASEKVDYKNVPLVVPAGTIVEIFIAVQWFRKLCTLQNSAGYLSCVISEILKVNDNIGEKMTSIIFKVII